MVDKIVSDMTNLEDNVGGQIKKQYVVYCATCAEIDYVELDKAKDAEKLFRIRGWSETDQFGWICPECVKKDRSKLKVYVQKPASYLG